MAYDVIFELPKRILGNADIEFSVKHDGKKIGTLKVSKGSVVWVKKDHEHGHKLGWRDFADMMIANGKSET